ncbi:MAG: DegT/DnrJ/EryC1/StrS family aminotransferase [Opitutaceae bacterium]
MQTQSTVGPLEPRILPTPGMGQCMIGEEETALVNEVMRSGLLFRYYGLTPQDKPAMAATLEREFREKVGSRYALAVTSGTAALECALAALGVGPGDEVIVPVWSWISCVSAIVRVGGTPVLADIDESMTIPASEIERLATDRTKVALLVHFQGVACDMDAIMEVCRRRKILVLEDCASCVGASHKGRRVGSIGDIGIYSFQFMKVMTSGEGGMVVTNDARLFERAVRMHDVGQARPVHAGQIEPKEIQFFGSNFRMTELTAAVGLAQLRKLDGMIEKTRHNYDRLVAGILDLPGVEERTMADPAGAIGLEMYLRLPTPEAAKAITAELSRLGIPSAQRTGTYAQYAREYIIKRQAHHPAASPFREVKDWPAVGYRPEDFPVTNDVTARSVVLPVGVLYSDEDIDFIIAAFRQAHRLAGL